MAENFAWLVSLLADFAQIASVFSLNLGMSFSKFGWTQQARETVLKYRRYKNGFEVSLKRTIKRG